VACERAAKEGYLGLTDSELKEIIINTFCYSEYDLDDIEVVQFYCWLLWALGLTNS